MSRQRGITKLKLRRRIGLCGWVATLMFLVACSSASHLQSRQLESVSEQLLQVWTEHKSLIVGEIHGTKETPAVVETLLENQAKQSPDILLGLEIDYVEQDRIDRYLDSNGSPDARRNLLTGGFWKKQDGRASVAMLKLIDAVRIINSKHGRVKIFCFDGVRSGKSRDETMAEIILEHASNPHSYLLILTGNLHAKLSTNPDTSSVKPMGGYLGSLKPFSIAVVANSGSSWSCIDTCGVNLLYDQPATKPEGFIKYWPGEKSGYSGVVRLREFSPSVPAINQTN